MGRGGDGWGPGTLRRGGPGPGGAAMPVGAGRRAGGAHSVLPHATCQVGLPAAATPSPPVRETRKQRWPGGKALALRVADGALELQVEFGMPPRPSHSHQAPSHQYNSSCCYLANNSSTACNTELRTDSEARGGAAGTGVDARARQLGPGCRSGATGRSRALCQGRRGLGVDRPTTQHSEHTTQPGWWQLTSRPSNKLIPANPKRRPGNGPFRGKSGGGGTAHASDDEQETGTSQVFAGASDGGCAAIRDARLLCERGERCIHAIRPAMMPCAAEGCM
jgi:hypothetical protein